MRVPEGEGGEEMTSEQAVQVGAKLTEALKDYVVTQRGREGEFVFTARPVDVADDDALKLNCTGIGDQALINKAVLEFIDAVKAKFSA